MAYKFELELELSWKGIIGIVLLDVQILTLSIKRFYSPLGFKMLEKVFHVSTQTIKIESHIYCYICSCVFLSFRFNT